MFLKYPKKVRYKITELLKSTGMVVIRRGIKDKKWYNIADKLEEEDIEARTEIFTKYGKCKILNMQDRWYMFIQPSNVIVKRYREMRYRQGFCDFIATSECSKEELLKLYLNRLEHMKVEHINYRASRFNLSLEEYINATNYNLKVISSIIKYDRESSELKYSYISDENMERFNEVFETVEDIKGLSQTP